jgi:hypothetical protein
MADIVISYAKGDAEEVRQLVQYLSAQGLPVWADIVISYAKGDAEEVRQLVQHLSAQGWSVSVYWNRPVPPGKKWREVLEAELLPGACVIIPGSKTSIRWSWIRWSWVDKDIFEDIYFVRLHKTSIATPPVGGGGTVNFNLRSPIAETSSVILTRRF